LRAAAGSSRAKELGVPDVKTHSSMPKSLASPTPEQEVLTDEQLSQLIAVEHWALLDPELDELTTHVPATTVIPERTTILTWIYQQRGVMSFAELAERITGFETVTARKRQLRAMLRGLEKLLLISIVNFTGEVSTDEGDSHEDVIGKNSLVSLTWTGMVWMRRAWAARARLASTRSIEAVHKLMVDEEDDGKANDPFWVENISTVDPEGPGRRAERIQAFSPGIASVFDLARAKGRKT
jgi:hypothetical protein